MFNKENENINIKEAETIIGPSIKVKGNFHGQGNIIIEGQVEGSIKTNGFLLIGNKSVISANIEAKNAKVNGLVSGNLKIDGYLEIGNTANIKGDMEAKSISIGKGAQINGRVCMGGMVEKTELK